MITQETDPVIISLDLSCYQNCDNFFFWQFSFFPTFQIFLKFWISSFCLKLLKLFRAFDLLKIQIFGSRLVVCNTWIHLSWEKIPTFFRWRVEVTGPTETLYDGEQFCLQFKFGPKYPFESPEVTFVGDKVPVHPHIYSNGHICLSILTEDWSPALSVETVCLSITSMLSSAKEKVKDWY